MAPDRDGSCHERFHGARQSGIVSGVTETLRLFVIDGPGSPGVGEVLECAGTEATIGRSEDCTHCLPDPWVSREHARFLRRGDRWVVADCDSTAGTFVNAGRLLPGESAELSDGDEIGIGPWRLRVGALAAMGGPTIALRGDTTGGASIHTPTRRLRALSSCIERLIDAPDEAALARVALESVIEGSGFRRGAVLRPPPTGGGSAPLVMALGRERTVWQELGEGAFVVPSSLVSTAALGHTAVIQDQAVGSDISESIVSSSIHSAVCSPVKLDGRVAFLIYLDSRGEESPVGDAASFCDDVAQVYAMALAHLGRVEMERKQAEMRVELGRAAAMRAMLEPAELVEHAPIRIAHRMSAGHVVTGDLVDVHPQDDGSVIVLIGDAMGHGVGAALLTSLAQAHLHAEITRESDIVRAVERTNTFIAERPTDGSFVTLWAGRVHSDGVFEFVDAGHGHWLVVRADGAVEPVERATGLPLGVEASATYGIERGRLSPGDRIVLYTDGVVEQYVGGGAGDKPLGAEGVAAIVSRLKDCEADVGAVLDALGGADMADDATILSIEYRAKD